MMTDIKDNSERDRGGRFQTGHKAAGPGRPVGARSRLGTAFLEDLAESWHIHGASALRRCAVEDPSQFCRIVAGLLPKQLDLAIEHSVDVVGILQTFRQAVSALQADQPPPLKVTKSSLKVVESHGK